MTILVNSYTVKINIHLTSFMNFLTGDDTDMVLVDVLLL